MLLFEYSQCAQNTFLSKWAEKQITKTGEIAQFPHPNPAQQLPATHFRAGFLSLSANKLSWPPCSQTFSAAKQGL